jgi:hypothetical protein
MLSITRGLASVYSLLSPSKAMAAPLNMEIYNERLASFETARPSTKKRGSNTKGNKSSKWPHKSPTPVQVSSFSLFTKLKC